MVVIGTRRKHDVGLPLPDLSDDLPAHVQAGHQFAIVVVEGFVLDADPPARLLRLLPAARGERSPALALMAGVAVSHRDELHVVAKSGVLGGQAA